MERKFKRILREINSGEREKSFSIISVDYYMIEKTSYSFHFYAVYKRNEKDVLTEFLYDLRNKKYFIERNGREVKFSEANLDTVIPREKGDWLRHRKGFYSRDSAERFFRMIEVPENEGMYKSMMNLIGAIGEERTDMSSRALIRLITEYNKLELLYKAGFEISRMNQPKLLRMVKEAVRNNATKLHQVFGVTKSQLKLAKSYSQGTNDFLNTIESLQGLEQKHIDHYRSFHDTVLSLQEKYHIEGRSEVFKRNSGGLMSYSQAYKRHRLHNQNYRFYNRGFFDLIMEYDFPNEKKLLEYLLFECLLSQGLDFSNAISEYRDYYRMCMDMNYERFDRYPKYLKTYHDIVARNYKEVQDDVEKQKFVDVVSEDEYKELEGKAGTLVMVTPKEPLDLVTEGNVLGHCVGSYCKQVINKDTQIAFLRKKDHEDDPYITVEIRGDKITQYRGKGNRLPYDKEEAQEVRDSIKQYAKKKKMKVTARM